MRKALLVMAILPFFFLGSKASAAPIKLLAFQVGGIGIFPSVGEKHYSGQVAWIPSVNLGPVGVRGELGATLLKNILAESFFAFNYEAFLTLDIIPSVFSVEGGGGVSTWTGTGGATYPILSVYGVLGVPGLIDRIYAGYSRFFASGNGINEIKIGIGFSL